MVATYRHTNTELRWCQHYLRFLRRVLNLGPMIVKAALPVIAMQTRWSHCAARRCRRSRLVGIVFVWVTILMFPGCARIDENDRPAAETAQSAPLAPSSEPDSIRVSIRSDLPSDGVTRLQTPFGWFSASVARGRPELGGDARDLYVIPVVSCAAEYLTMAFRFNDDHDASQGVSLVVTKDTEAFRPEGELQRLGLPKDMGVSRSTRVRGVLSTSRADVSEPGTVIEFDIFATGIGGSGHYSGTFVTP